MRHIGKYGHDKREKMNNFIMAKEYYYRHKLTLNIIRGHYVHKLKKHVL